MTFSAHPGGAARRLVGCSMEGRPVFVRGSHGHEAAGDVGQEKRVAVMAALRERRQLGSGYPQAVGVTGKGLTSKADIICPNSVTIFRNKKFIAHLVRVLFAIISHRGLTSRDLNGSRDEVLPDVISAPAELDLHH